MDPSDFPSPFDPLTLPEKPLAGDLPVDMEFGEDLLESQTAPSRGWAPPGPSPSSGALDLLDTPSGLEKDLEEFWMEPLSYWGWGGYSIKPLLPQRWTMVLREPLHGIRGSRP